MFNKLYKNVNKAWQLTVGRTQFQFILVLLVIFPLLFIFMLQQFQFVAKKQVESIIKETISHDHESISRLLSSGFSSGDVSRVISSYVEDGGLTTVVTVAREDNGEVVIVFTTETDTLGSKVQDKSIYKSAIAHDGSSVIYPFLRNGERVWLTYRAVVVDGKQWYVHAEVSLADIDFQMAKQVTNAYYILSIVFVFLGMLIWWVWKQYDYKKAWQTSEAKLKEQFSFTNMMVHELRAPLTAIRGYASLISEAGDLPIQHKQSLDRVSESSARLSRLVSDFLEVARIQAGTLGVSVKEQDIRETISTVVAEMISVAEAKNLKLTFTVPESPVIISTDVARLHQVVTNLLSNAIKYTNKGEINVILKSDSLCVEIRIQDTGNGISAKDQSKLFKPFVRVGKADEGVEVGSGLGMWITKRLVELLNGDVDIESIENVGTHVIVHLYKNKK